MPPASCAVDVAKQAPHWCKLESKLCTLLDVLYNAGVTDWQSCIGLGMGRLAASRIDSINITTTLAAAATTAVVA